MTTTNRIDDVEGCGIHPNGPYGCLACLEFDALAVRRTAMERKGRLDASRTALKAERMLSDQLAEAAEAAQRWILRGTMTDGSEDSALRLLHEALKAYREDRR